MAEAGKPPDDLRGDALLHGGGTAVFAGAARRQTPDAAVEGIKSIESGGVEAVEAIEGGGSKAVKAIEGGGIKAVKAVESGGVEAVKAVESVGSKAVEAIEAPDGICNKIPERAEEEVTIRGGIPWSFVFPLAGVL